MMSREQYALISTSLATPVPDRSAKRLPLPAAIFLIGVLSLGGWTAIIFVAFALV